MEACKVRLHVIDPGYLSSASRKLEAERTRRVEDLQGGRLAGWRAWNEVLPEWPLSRQRQAMVVRL